MNGIDAAVHATVDPGSYAPTCVTRGLYGCELRAVGDDDDSRLGWHDGVGHWEIRVVGADGARYAAPSLLHHYVVAHGCLPPAPFMLAVERAADVDLDTAEALDLCLGCRSAMTRIAVDHVMRGAAQERGIGATFRCDGCGVDYSR